MYLREGTRMSEHESSRGFPQHNNVGTFIGQFGIGELQKYAKNKQVRVVYRGLIIWDSRDDVLQKSNYDRFR